MDQDEIGDFSESLIMLNTKKENGKEVIYLKPTDGVFDFIDRFSFFLITSLSIETIDLIPTEMYDFNLEILPAIINFIEYGSNSSYHWLESMVYNFNKVFRAIWLNKDFKKWSTSVEKEFVWSLVGKKTHHPLIPRSNITVICGQCKKKISKGSKLFPVCFQGSDDPSTYPKEIVANDSPVKGSWNGVLTADQLLNFDVDKFKKRGIKIVCNVQCLLEAMANMDQNVHEIVVRVPQILASREIDKATFMDMGYAENIYHLFPAFPRHSYNYLIDEGVLKIIRKNKEKIVSLRLKKIVESVYPEGRLKVMDNKVKICAETETRKFKDKEADKIVNELTRMKKRSPQEIPECVSEYLSTLTSPSDEKKHLLWRGKGIYHNIITPEDYVKKSVESGVDFKLNLKICDVDRNSEEVRDIEKAFKNLKLRTLRLFPLKFVEEYIEGFKEEFYKGFLSGISKNDKASLTQALKLNSPVLGIWEDIEDEEDNFQFVYIIVCRTANSVIAMIPKCMDECVDFLLQVFQTKISEQLVNNLYCLWKLNFIEALKVVRNDEDFKSLPEEIQDNFISLLFAFGKLHSLTCRKKYEGNIQLSGICDKRFRALHTMNHNDGLNEILYHSPDNSLRVAPPSHLSACSHNIVWSGNLFIAEEDFRFRVSAWAYSCNSTESVPKDLIKDLQIPSIEIMILSRKESMFMEYDDDGDNPIIINFNIGSIPGRIVRLIKNPKCLALSLLNDPYDDAASGSTIKTILRYFHCQSGKIYAKVMPPKLHNGFQSVISTVLSEMAPSAINFVNGIATLHEDVHKQLIDRHLKTNNINHKLRPLNARCLWIGEMQCLIRENRYHVVGFGVSKKLMNMEYDYQALITLKDDDFGAIKNGPVNPSPGHYVYSNYVAITPVKDNNVNKTLEEFFKKGVESGLALVAMNVERRIVDNIIGSYRKCHSVMVRAQDGFHLTQELKLEKRIMLAFFLKRNEQIFDVLRAGSENYKQFCILRYDDQTSKLSLYFPKEKDKMLQVWKSVRNGALMTFHEKMFREFEKSDTVKKCKTNNFESKEEDEEGQNLGDEVPMSSENLEKDEPVRKGCESKDELVTTDKVNKDKKGKTSDHDEEVFEFFDMLQLTSDAKADNLSEAKVLEHFDNFKFTSDAESPPAQAEIITEGKKEKICWNCHASAADLGSKLLKCGSCRKARYCDPECQQEDWGRHREFCGQVQEIRRQREETDMD